VGQKIIQQDAEGGGRSLIVEKGRALAKVGMKKDLMRLLRKRHSGETRR